MLIGVPKEIKNHEYRVGMAPASVREAVTHGHQIMVQDNAGEGISASDDEYRAVGAQIVDDPQEIFASADMIVKVKEPQANERAMLRPGRRGDAQGNRRQPVWPYDRPPWTWAQAGAGPREAT